MDQNTFDRIYNRCIQTYTNIISNNPLIDSGHGISHVKNIERLSKEALNEYIFYTKKNPEKIVRYINDYFKGDLTCLDIPDDCAIRIMVASLLHEVDDNKFKKDNQDNNINEILDFVLQDYVYDTKEMRHDIINIIDYCGASKWGDRIPEKAKIYHLIVRTCDRLEATGWIGVARALTYTYVKRQPLVREEDQFPKTMEELEEMAPYTRFEEYSKNKKSASAFSHYLDKIVHISGSNVPFFNIKELLDNGQKTVKQFVLDFTNKFDRKFDIDYIASSLDPELYESEIIQLKEMKETLLKEGCTWIKP